MTQDARDVSLMRKTLFICYVIANWREKCH